MRTNLGSVRDEILFFDDTQEMSRTHHIGEISTPGRVEPAGQTESVVLNFIQSRSGHDAACLHFFPESHQVWLHVKMLATPIATGRSHAALHFVEDEKHLVLIADPAEGSKPFTAKMIVTAFTLDRLDDDRSDVDPAFINELHDLLLGFSLA